MPLLIWSFAGIRAPTIFVLASRDRLSYQHVHCLDNPRNNRRFRLVLLRCWNLLMTCANLRRCAFPIDLTILCSLWELEMEHSTYFKRFNHGSKFREWRQKQFNDENLNVNNSFALLARRLNFRESLRKSTYSKTWLFAKIANLAVVQKFVQVLVYKKQPCPWV